MKLTITCHTNPDLPGKWDQADVEQEMKELDMKVTGQDDEWLEYVLGHVFDDAGLPLEVYNAIMSGNVQSITFKTESNDIVKLSLDR